MQLLSSGPSADVFRLADGRHVVAFAPPLYVSTAGVVYLDTSQLGEQILWQILWQILRQILRQTQNSQSCSHL